MPISLKIIAKHPTVKTWFVEPFDLYSKHEEQAKLFTQQLAQVESQGKTLQSDGEKAVNTILGNPASNDGLEQFYYGEDSDRFLWKNLADSLEPASPAYKVAINAYQWLNDISPNHEHIGDNNAHMINYYNWLKAYNNGVTSDPIGKFYGFY